MRDRANERWISEPEEFGHDPASYRSPWRERARREALEQRRRRRKAALLAFVVFGWIAITVAGATPMTTLKAVGLRMLQGAILAGTAWLLWRFVKYVDDTVQEDRRRGLR